MVEWLEANIGTIIVSIILVIIIFLVVYGMIKNKKKGKTTCGCGCANCAMSASCHKQPSKEDKT